MNNAQFDKYVEDMEAAELGIRLQKGASYREGDPDVLAHFRKSALTCGLDPATVCMVFLNKHLSTLQSRFGDPNFPPKKLKSTINDARNYLLYLGAICGVLREDVPTARPTCKASAGTCGCVAVIDGLCEYHHGLRTPFVPSSEE